MASILSNPAFQEALTELSKVVKPQSSADIAALGVFVVSSAAYLLRSVTWDKPDPYHHIWFERPQLKNGGTLNANKETRNIAQKLEESNKDLVIFWGSQSGTAEGFANRLARECHVRFGLETMAADLSDFDADTIALIPESKLAIFICSTFGEGDPSDNTAAFWDYLLKTKDVSLKSLRYMAFGLGNSNYKYYNRVIDVIVEALDKFGARSLLPVAKADDASGGTEEDFMAWKDDLFAVFKNELKLQEREIKYEPTLSVVEDESLEPVDLHDGEPSHPHDNPKAAAACSPIKALAIQNPQELFKSKDRNCVHMELDLAEHPELKYKTGDHLAVWPTNPDAEVDRLLHALGLSSRRDVPITIKSLDPAVKVKVPTPTTAAVLFRHYLEICAPVSRDTILSLAPFAPTPAAKAFLLSLGTDKTAYATYLTHTHLTLGRLLTLAHSSSTWPTLPLSYLIESLPRLQPRYYSISSSSAISPRHPSIAALVSPTPLPTPKDPSQPSSIPGLTSSYLLQQAQAHNAPNTTGLVRLRLHAHVRKSKFKLPTASTTPVILIGAGTGLAPFRAFCAERARLASLGRPVGTTLLFVGCRRAGDDWIYRDEFEGWAANELRGVLRIVVAASREGKGGYVQDRVREEMGEVLGLVEGEGAGVYLCGRAGMAREVARVVGEGRREREGLGEGEVREWAEGLRRRGRWQEDVWG